MKQKLQTGLVLGMIFLAAITFGQTTQTAGAKQNEEQKSAKTYFDLMINVVSTNLNYGASNTSLADYKKSNNGVQAGVSFQAGITSHFSLVSELYFLRKGGKLKAGNPLSANESTLHLNSIEFPLMARVHLGRFYMNAGPSIAYNMSGTNKIGNESTKLSFGNGGAGFKRFDAGVQMGGGVEFPLKQKRIAVDIRYNYGLTNITYNDEIRNRAVMISVHFSKAWKRNPLGKN